MEALQGVASERKVLLTLRGIVLVPRKPEDPKS